MGMVWINKCAFVFVSTLIGFAVVGCSPGTQGSTEISSMSEPPAATTSLSSGAGATPVVGGPASLARQTTGVFPTDSGAISHQQVPLPVRVFEMYCYRTDASYKTIVGMAKAMKLKPIPKDLEPLISARDGEGHGYVVKLEKSSEGVTRGVMLGVSQRNVCSVAAIGYDVESVVVSVKRNYHLFPIMHDDTGLQVDDLFIPDGKSSHVSETHENGVIGMTTGKANAGRDDKITLSYVPPSTAQQIFQ